MTRIVKRALTAVMAVMALWLLVPAVALAGAEGTWTTTVQGQHFTLTLSANGAATLNDERGQWSESGNRVTLVDGEGERVTGERSGNRLSFVIEGVELVFSRSGGEAKRAKPDAPPEKQPRGAGFRPDKVLKGKTVRPKGSGASFTVPKGWKHKWGKADDGSEVYVVTPPKGGETYPIFLLRAPLDASARGKRADELLRQQVTEYVGDVAVDVRVAPELFSVGGRDAARTIFRSKHRGMTVEGYFVGIIVDDYVFVIASHYDASIADTMRPGINTIVASFKAKAPPQNTRLKKRLLGCWEYYSGSTDSGGSSSSQTKWRMAADGTYSKKGYTSVSVGGSSSMSEHAEAGVYRVVGNTVLTTPTKGAGGSYGVTWKGQILFLNGTKYIPCN